MSTSGHSCNPRAERERAVPDAIVAGLRVRRPVMATARTTLGRGFSARFRKMQDAPKQPQKKQIRVASVVEMAPDQQPSFEKAVDALLADLVRSLDRLNTQETDGTINEE